MPHVEIFCYPGRTDEQKTRCAEQVTEVIAETLNCPAGAVSVTVKEVEKEEWPAFVEENIKPVKLYQTPDYLK